MSLDAIADLPRDPEVAWLFPGQGAQHPGMGRDLYEQSAAAREVFDRVDAALDIPLSRICFEGEEAELTRTVNAQPALVPVPSSVWSQPAAAAGSALFLGRGLIEVERRLFPPRWQRPSRSASSRPDF